jgi:hypothetical protein
MTSLTIDRAPGGGWIVIEVATGDVLLGPFRTAEEATLALEELSRARRALSKLSEAQSAA